MFRKILFVSICFVSMISLIQCTSGKNDIPMQEPTRLQKIYVDNVNSEGIVQEPGKLIMKISGNLPTPAYRFERFSIHVKGNIVEITPLATYDRTKMAAQVLVPFQEICKVENLKPGKYAIKVFGRSKTVSDYQMTVSK